MDQPVEAQFTSEFRSVINRLVKKLRWEAPSGRHLSMTERSTLAQLYQQKTLLPSELAANEHITNQSMSQVLNHLSELGYIARLPSETDKRKVHISLTEKGESVFMQFRHERDEWLFKAVTTACTAEEQELFKMIIGPLNKVLDFK
jgi:DNA-binding MarR family transcriptional regulator